MIFYIEDIARPSYKNFLWASQKNFHTSTSKAEHLQDLHARTFEGGFEQDLHKIFSQGPAQDIARTSYMISAISKIFTRSSHKDLHKILHGPLRWFQQGLLIRTCCANKSRPMHKKAPFGSRFERGPATRRAPLQSCQEKWPLLPKYRPPMLSSPGQAATK